MNVAVDEYVGNCPGQANAALRHCVLLPVSVVGHGPLGRNSFQSPTRKFAGVFHFRGVVAAVRHDPQVVDAPELVKRFRQSPVDLGDMFVVCEHPGKVVLLRVCVCPRFAIVMVFDNGAVLVAPPALQHSAS